MNCNICLEYSDENIAIRDAEGTELKIATVLAKHFPFCFDVFIIYISLYYFENKTAKVRFAHLSRILNPMVAYAESVGGKLIVFLNFLHTSKRFIRIDGYHSLLERKCLSELSLKPITTKAPMQMKQTQIWVEKLQVR